MMKRNINEVYAKVKKKRQLFIVKNKASENFVQS